MDYEYPQGENRPPFPYRPEEQQESEPRRKHSGPGIASFIMSLLTIAGYIAGLSLTFVTLHRIGEAELSEEILMNQQGFVISVFVVIASVVINIAGIILAIIGLALKNRKKVFSVLGLVFGLLPLIILILLFIIGITVAGTSDLQM
ncbi:hypothetical protein [Paenibacillus caui]|uniref:hypothetical protein n=1 Tax=Paenibacillus caui TaxID=2873927 RepID=UPI001CA97AEC|nr:hypothetical protein [Paenibacillus caui]